MNNVIAILQPKQQHNNGFTTELLQGQFEDLYGTYNYCVRIFNLVGEEVGRTLLDTLVDARNEVKNQANVPADSWPISDQKYYIA